jgi:hypothetical protein
VGEAWATSRVDLPTLYVHVCVCMYVCMYILCVYTKFKTICSWELSSKGVEERLSQQMCMYGCMGTWIHVEACSRTMLLLVTLMHVCFMCVCIKYLHEYIRRQIQQYMKYVHNTHNGLLIGPRDCLYVPMCLHLCMYIMCVFMYLCMYAYTDT